MIHVSRIHFRRNLDGSAGQERSIQGGAYSPLFCTPPKVRKPRAQNGGLHFVEPAVDADFDVTIPVGLSSVAQPSDTRGQRSVAGDDGAAVAQGAEILCGVEAERARGSERADGAASGCGEMRL